MRSGSRCRCQGLRSAHKTLAPGAFCFALVWLLVVSAQAAKCASDESTRNTLVTATVQVNKALPQDIREWGNDTSLVILRLRGSAITPAEVIVRTLVYKDSHVVAYTRAGDASVVSLTDATTTLRTHEIFPPDGIECLWSLSGTITRRGSLRPGEYMIRCQVLNAQNTDEVLAQSNDATCAVQGFEAPALIEPPTYHWISLKRDLEFRWNPVSMLPPWPGTVRYKLLLYEVPEGSDPDEVEHRRKPMFQAYSSAASPLGMKFQPSKIPLRLGGMYVWTVQAVGDDGKPYGDDSGYAESFVFRVRR